MLHIMNAENWIDPRSEMKYQFHQTIDMSCYPQVHDFYELSLVIEGKLNVTVDGWNQDIAVRCSCCARGTSTAAHPSGRARI